MTDLVEPGKAKAAGFVSVILGFVAFADIVSGLVYASMGGEDGSGLWTGFGLALCSVLGLLTWWKRNKTAMVFFLLLDILWFIVCVAGVVFSFILWTFYHIFVTRSATEARCFMKDADTCYCMRKGETDIKYDVHCDDVEAIDHCLLAIVILNALGAVFALSGSVIGCMGTCCAQQNTRVVVVGPHGMS